MGARMVKAWADPQLQRAAESALAKIHSVLPNELRDELNRNQLFAPETNPYPVHWLGQLRQAIRQHHKLLISYRDERGKSSQRCVWPLGLFFWGQTWTLCSWCELRNDFRNFRIDRVEQLQNRAETFEAVEGQRLEDYLKPYLGGHATAPLYKS